MHDVAVSLLGFLDALPDAAVLVDAKGLVAHVNGAATSLLRAEAGSLSGLPLDDLIPLRFRQDHGTHVAQFQAEGTAALSLLDRPLIYAQARDGQEVPVTISLAPLKVGRDLFTLALLRDASTMHHRLGEALLLAETDPLTALGNRAFAQRKLEALAGARAPFAVLFLDLVGFKGFNDHYGHHVGDEVLRVIGQRLSSAVRSLDSAARLGGDEFVVLMAGLSDADLLLARAEAISRHLTQPLQVRSVMMPVGVTIGGALFPRHGATAELLLQSADQAMYRAKREHLDFCLHGAQPLRFGTGTGTGTGTGAGAGAGSAAGAGAGATLQQAR